MKPLFYSFFAFCGGSFLFFVVFGLAFLGTRKAAFREFLKLKRDFGLRERRLKRQFELILGTVLLSGMGLSWFWTGRFVFGLSFWVLAPYSFRMVAHFRQRRIYSEIDGSALSFFHGLLGLIRVGKSLPTALFELSASTQSPFATLLLKYLKNYEEGKALPHLLGRFRNRSRLELTGVYLSGLEMAYRRGLSVVPLLERMIPTLETEFSARERMNELKVSAQIQAGIAFLVPWVLLVAFRICEPELFQNFASSKVNLAVAGAVLFVEGVGIWLIRTLSSFY